MFAQGPICISIDSGVLSSISIISRILDKGYQICPCFSIKCSNKGLLPIICLILNLSQKGIITEPGKLITFPFTITVTFFQSISSISHTLFLCNLILSLCKLPVNLNKCILPVVLHNLIRMYDFIFDMNINTLIVLEYWCFLKIGILCLFNN